MAKLSHVDREGKARMVDVGAKAVTRREAAASAFIKLGAATLSLVRANKIAKGDVLDTARLAGIQAAKKAHDLIPLAHPIPLENVVVDLEVLKTGIRVCCRVAAEARPGEMEALTGGPWPP
jgi:cyclic pyranopterin phosphate synthase